jgi:hypothetical protein
MPTKPVAITDKVPIPASAGAPSALYKFDRMKIGDSMFRSGNSKANTPATNMRTAASIYKRKNPGWNYHTRKDTVDGVEGSRLWRIS